MLTKLPLLDQDFAAGTGKLGRHLKLRLTSGTEVGRRLADVTFEHSIATEEDATELEAYIPGALEAFRASREPAESRKRGKRPYGWTPEQGNVKMILCPAGGGAKIYEGAAEVVRATLRNSEKACVLTVHARLHEVEADDGDTLSHLVEHLGEAVDYELTAVRIEGAAGTSVDSDQALPFPTATAQGVPVQAGDLVVGAMGDDLDTEVVGLAVVVHAGGAVVHETFDKSTPSIEVPLDRVLIVHQLTGPMGGVFDPTKMPDGLRGADMLQAITDGTEKGTLVRGPQGFAVTKALVQAAKGFHEASLPEAV